MSKGNRLRTASGAITATGALALTVWIGSEGNKLYSYRDVIGVWTACAGETKGIGPGMKFTKEECDKINIETLERYLPDRCIYRPMSDKTYVAFLAFAGNVGSGHLCKNIAPLYNAGREREACDRMLLYNRAGGMVWKGLVDRRQRERKLCLEGLG